MRPLSVLTSLVGLSAAASRADASSIWPTKFEPITDAPFFRLKLCSADLSLGQDSMRVPGLGAAFSFESGNDESVSARIDAGLNDQVDGHPIRLKLAGDDENSGAPLLVESRMTLFDEIEKTLSAGKLKPWLIHNFTNNREGKDKYLLRTATACVGDIDSPSKIDVHSLKRAKNIVALKKAADDNDNLAPWPDFEGEVAEQIWDVAAKVLRPVIAHKVGPTGELTLGITHRQFFVPKAGGQYTKAEFDKLVGPTYHKDVNADFVVIIFCNSFIDDYVTTFMPRKDYDRYDTNNEFLGIMPIEVPERLFGKANIVSVNSTGLSSGEGSPGNGWMVAFNNLDREGVVHAATPPKKIENAAAILDRSRAYLDLPASAPSDEVVARSFIHMTVRLPKLIDPLKVALDWGPVVEPLVKIPFINSLVVEKSAEDRLKGYVENGGFSTNANDPVHKIFEDRQAAFELHCQRINQGKKSDADLV